MVVFSSFGLTGSANTYLSYNTHTNSDLNVQRVILYAVKTTPSLHKREASPGLGELIYLYKYKESLGNNPKGDTPTHPQKSLMGIEYASLLQKTGSLLWMVGDSENLVERETENPEPERATLQHFVARTTHLFCSLSLLNDVIQVSTQEALGWFPIQGVTRPRPS